MVHVFRNNKFKKGKITSNLQDIMNFSAKY